MIGKGIGLLLLCMAAVTDMKTKRVPLWNILLLAADGIVAGLRSLLRGAESPGGLLLSMLPGLMLLLLHYLNKEAVGAGDGALMLSAGPVYGARLMIAGVMLAFLCSALMSVVLLASKKAGRKSCLPFVPFLAAGTGVMLFALS